MATIETSAADVLAQQLAEITQAAKLLAATAERLSSQINPDTAHWGDVASFGYAAEMARCVSAAYAVNPGM